MQRYLETRTTAQTNTTAADVARHLLTRQHLGKAVVICDKPVATMSVTKKYWLRLARNLQKERASTLNVERILQLTHDITRMHHMEFAAKPLSMHPHADVFFVTRQQLGDLPVSCFSLYVMDVPAEKEILHVISQLPDRSLVIDYTRSQAMLRAPLLPKHLLEHQIPAAWQRVRSFLLSHDIDIDTVVACQSDNRVLDQAIDDLLNVGSQFLRVADDFLELLRLAQPVNVAMAEQRAYDMLRLLARRIHALTPGTLSQQFINSLSDEDGALHDAATEHPILALTA